MPDSPERIAKRRAYQQSPEGRAKKKAYDAKRFQRNATKLRQQQAEYNKRPEVIARRKTYLHERYLRLKADPVALRARINRDLRRRRIRMYGTDTPTPGQLSLDGKHRAFTPGVKPKPKARKAIIIKPPKPPKIVKPKISTGLKIAGAPVKPVIPVEPKPYKPPWVPTPVGIDTPPPPETATTYLCERPTCKRTFTTKFFAQRHFQKEHYND